MEIEKITVKLINVRFKIESVVPIKADAINPTDSNTVITVITSYPSAHRTRILDGFVDLALIFIFIIFMEVIFLSIVFPLD